MYLLNLAQILHDGALPMGVSTPSKLSKMFPYVSGTSKKNLVHGALIEAEIMTSPSPMYFLNLAQFWLLALCPQVCQHLLIWSRDVSRCLRNLKKIGTWGLSRSWDIDLPTFPCICSTWTSFWALALNPWVCQHLLSGKEMFVCVSGISKKFDAWGPNRRWDSDVSPPHVFAEFGLVFSTGTLLPGVSTPPKWFTNIPMCLRNLQKCLVHASTMRSEHNSISEVPTPDLLRVYKPVPDPQGVMCQHIEVPILGGGKHPSC